MCKTKTKNGPKRAGYLYEEIYDIENLKRAIMNASKKKRNHKNVKKVIDGIDEYSRRLSVMLRNETYAPLPYTTKTINDGIKQKKRNIAMPHFYPDQCVHHALIQVLEPKIMRSMYYYCCGSVRGRGDKRIQKALVKWIKKRPGKSKYVLKMDVRHFYESIDHSELMHCLEKKIKDRKVLRLCSLIIESCPKGIPIGNYTSQWFCNLFLEDVDHKVKEYLGKDYIYVRYIDDMVIVGANKRKLHRARKIIADLLTQKKLELKDNWQVFKLKNRPLDFIGCKFYSDGHVELRKSILKRIKRKARKIESLGDAVSCRHAASMMAYMGRIHHTDSEFLYSTDIMPKIGSTKRMRRIISNERNVQRKARRSLGGGFK